MHLVVSFLIMLAVTSGVASANSTPLPACDVTQPNNVPQPPVPNGPLPGSTYSQNDLWVSIGSPTEPFIFYADQELGPDAGDQAGLRANKMLWIRGESVEAQLDVRATRLDGDSPDATMYPPEGNTQYGETGFTVVSLAFPAPGCWEITATTGDATLTMTAEVVFLGERDATPAATPSD